MVAVAPQLRAHAALFQALTDAVLITDSLGRVVDCNPAAERMFGRERNAILGRVPGEWSDPGAARARMVRVLQVVSGGDRWSADVPFARADGRWRVAASTVIGLFDDDGAFLGAVGISRDVTEDRARSRRLSLFEQQTSLAWQHAPHGLALVGLDGRFLHVNHTLCSLLGYEQSELVALTFQVLTHPEDLALDLQHVQDLLAGQVEQYSMRKRYFRRDGSILWALLSVGLVRDPDTAAPVHFVASIQDITADHHAEQAAAAAAARQTNVIAAHAAIAEADLEPDAVMASVCHQAMTLTSAVGAVIELRDGHDMVYQAVAGTASAFHGLRLALVGSLSGTSLLTNQTLTCADTDTDARVNAAACRRVGLRSMIVTPLRHHGTPIGVLKVLSDRPDAFTTDDVGLLELLAAPFGSALGNAHRMRTTYEQATTDGLTGLANRRHILHELERAAGRHLRRADRGRHLAVLLADLDGFKTINDTHGHAAGDSVLVQASRRIQNILRTTDTAGRLGGDEFLIICEDLATATDAQILADRLSAALSNPYPHGDEPPLHVGVSIGISTPAPTADISLILADADAAMYTVKRDHHDKTAATDNYRSTGLEVRD